GRVPGRNEESAWLGGRACFAVSGARGANRKGDYDGAGGGGQIGRMDRVGQPRSGLSAGADRRPVRGTAPPRRVPRFPTIDCVRIITRRDDQPEGRRGRVVRGQRALASALPSDLDCNAHKESPMSSTVSAQEPREVRSLPGRTYGYVRATPI